MPTNWTNLNNSTRSNSNIELQKRWIKLFNRWKFNFEFLVKRCSWSVYIYSILLSMYYWFDRYGKVLAIKKKLKSCRNILLPSLWSSVFHLIFIIRKLYKLFCLNKQGNFFCFQVSWSNYRILILPISGFFGAIFRLFSNVGDLAYSQRRATRDLSD